MTPRTLSLLTAALLLVPLIGVSAQQAQAQQAQTVRLRGTIEKVDGATLTLKTASGDTRLTLAAGAQVVAVIKATLADIKPDTFIGSAAMPQPDGTQKALEVHIFPESMRGTGEGHRPFPTPGSTMTNGAVDGAAVTGVQGSSIKVQYKGGAQTIVVPPNTPIVRYEIGSAAELKPGAAVTVTAATKKPDGSFETARINVGRDGVIPQ